MKAPIVLLLFRFISFSDIEVSAYFRQVRNIVGFFVFLEPTCCDGNVYTIVFRSRLFISENFLISFNGNMRVIDFHFSLQSLKLSFCQVSTELSFQILENSLGNKEINLNF
jgi:hypothetical protein